MLRDDRGRPGLVHVSALPLVLTFACVRAPDDGVCPDVDPGELVVTEIRGRQAGLDTLGQWIEIANRSGGTIDLHGLELELRDANGDLVNTSRRVLVRSELVAPRDGFVVLGHHEPARMPAFVDYSFFADYRATPDADGDVPIQATKDLVPGSIMLVACGLEIDRVPVDVLPDAGTRALDGAIEATAEQNDLAAHWCVDDEPAPPGSMTGAGIPGTPGAPNRPCPR